MKIDRRTFLRMSGPGAAMIVAGSGLVKNSVFAANTPKQQTSNVSFTGSSSSGTRKKTILDVLEPWRDTVTAGVKGKTIIIKPNVVSPGKALIATHVDALRACIEFLRTITSQPVIIAESAANRGVTSSFNTYGYNKLTSEYKDVSLLDLDGSTSKIPSVQRQIWKPDLSSTVSIPIFAHCVSPDYFVISITRPKTHNCQVITGVCKNILMSAPKVESKQLMHGKIGWWDGKHTGEDKCLAYNLFQLGNTIFSTGAPALSVLDAWEGMEGNGPASGTAVMQYCAVAGTDPLAVDRLCAKLMGLSDTVTEPMNKATPSYADARALYWLSNAGLGNYDLSKIDFLTSSLDDLKKYAKTYKLPDTYTGNPSYQTNWNGGPPDTVLDKQPVSVHDLHYLDPKPFLFPQFHKTWKGHIKIDFSLPIGFSINLGIYNLQGVEIRRLGYEYLKAGRYSILWDRRDNDGIVVSPGHYIIKLIFNGSRAISDKLMII